MSRKAFIGSPERFQVCDIKGYNVLTAVTKPPNILIY